jgi:hypothetical protein
MGVEVIPTRAVIEHLFERLHRTPGLRQAVKSDRYVAAHE